MRTSTLSATAILAQYQELGVTLAPGEYGALQVSPPGVLLSHLKEVLKAHKVDLLKLLTALSADFLSEEPCTMCGPHERWHWLAGRLLCRVCLSLDSPPLTLRHHAAQADRDR
jgi:hypothetical protein